MTPRVNINVGGGNKGTTASSVSTKPLIFLIVIVLVGGQWFFSKSCQLEGYNRHLAETDSTLYDSTYTYPTNSGSSPGGSTGSSGGGQVLSGHYDVCIAGAGLSGSVLAERYASELRKKVLVVEKRDHIGGNCYDYIDEDTGVRVSQYGAHLFHTYHDDVWNYVQNFGPWTKYEHKVRGIVNGKHVPIPVNIETVNTLFDLNIKTQEEMDEWLKKEQIPVRDGKQPRNSEEVALSRVGRRLYDLIFKPYTFKQWNKYPKELGPEVLQRIPVRNNWDDRYFSDPHQALPTNGYTSLFEEMLKSRYITVLTNTDYFAIRDQVSCGKVYFSGPIDSYFAHHNMPKLEYRSLDFERKVALNTEFFQPAFVVNHPQDNDDYTRIVEYKHLYNQGHLPHTVYFIERSSDEGEPYYPVPNKRNKDLFAQYQNLAQEEEKVKNVSFVGRLANYKYFNMDQAIKNALELFEKDTGIAYQMVDHDKPPEAISPAVAVVEPPASSGLLPEWREVVDCSAWDNMCSPTRNLESKYRNYPIPFIGHIKNYDRFNFKVLKGVPDEWQSALMVDNSLSKPPPRPVDYVYRKEVPAADKAKCIQDANTVDWKRQLKKLLRSGRIRKEKQTNMIAFTISDYNYAYDMMHDIFEMNDNVVGYKDAFFMVAIDKETVDLACTYGYPMVAWPSAKPDETTALKHAVANTKFEVSLELASSGIDFFFYEMDVWFLKSPKPLIAEFHSDKQNDILLSSHQQCTRCLNIGVYSVLANERTKEYFELAILMAQESPNTHDQWIMGQLLKLADSYHRFGKPNFKFEGKWNPPPKTNPPVMHHPPSRGFYNPFEIVAGERPIPTRNTYAIHTLCGQPLRKPFGKKIMAKELGAWSGFEGPNGEGGYYARSGANRRYLWMDGHDSPGSYNTVQNFEWSPGDGGIHHSIPAFQWTMATLLALARRTGRIFVMPKIIADHGSYYLWSLLDFEPVEEMGIDFRETNFPHNPKSWHSKDDPFQTFARTALAPTTKEGTMYVQYPNNKATGGVRGGNAAPGEEGEIKAWKFADGTSQEDALDAWWAAHTAIPEVDSAELLLVNPHFMDERYASNLDKKRRYPSGLTIAEQEIIAVYSKLKWCLADKGWIIYHGNVIGRSAADYACHGKGIPPLTTEEAEKEMAAKAQWRMNKRNNEEQEQ